MFYQNESHLERYESAFAMFDREQKGFISLKEFRNSCNMIGQKYTEEDIEILYGLLQKMPEECLTFEDFL